MSSDRGPYFLILEIANVAFWLTGMAAFAGAWKLLIQGVEWLDTGEWVEYSTRQAIVYFEIIDRGPITGGGVSTGFWSGA